MSKDRTGVRRQEVIDHKKMWKPGDSYWVENKEWIVGTGPVNSKTADYVMRAIDKAIQAEWERNWLDILKTPFEVLDALQGSISGEYEQDLKRLQKAGKTCTRELYDEAYQMSEQP